MTTTLSGRRVAVALSAALLGTVLAVAPPAAAATPAAPLTTGANDLGQQGDGTTAGRLSPGPTAGPEAVAMASGRDHAYLLDTQGRVWGWGNNQYGQVGDNSTTVRRTPVLTSLTNVTMIEAGHYHGIALRGDGTVWTWGFGRLGQLGQGTTTNRRVPTQVTGLGSDNVFVGGGRDMSYALKADGRVFAWGSNVNGEIGDGTTTTRLTPVLVPGLSGVVEVGVGRNHVLARTSAGEVYAWGDNAYGQVGNNSATDRRTPVLVIASGATAVDAGAHHSVALVGGRVFTWGRGYRGQLGLGTTSVRRVPTAVTIALPVGVGLVEVGDGRDQTFAVTDTGHVYAWGSNAAGQLGDGTTTQRNTPVLLTTVSGVVAVQSGSSHTVFQPGL